MKKFIVIMSLAIQLPFLTGCSDSSGSRVLWSIGDVDSSASDLALGPDGYKDFLVKDFGYEDRYFLVGRSAADKDFPYILAGPQERWAGGGAGWRPQEINILFGLQNVSDEADGLFEMTLLGTGSGKPTVLNVSINDRYESRMLNAGQNDSVMVGDLSNCKPTKISIPIEAGILKEGGNCIKITIPEGSWVVFDAISFTVSGGVKLVRPQDAFVRDVKAASYELQDNGTRSQPLLVDVEHLDGMPELLIKLDGSEIYTGKIDTGRFIIEALMPAVDAPTTSKYTVEADGKTLQKGTVERSPQPLQTFADYVDTRIGSAHSRWMIAPGPWMPFSMVKLSPDNQNIGWMAGYEPVFESIGCFSHIHEWTLGGLGMMPTNGKLQTFVGDQSDPNGGYRSRMDKATEETPLGHYKVKLTDYDILAELTATTRCSFQRYTYPKDRDNSRILIDLHIPTEYDYHIMSAEVKKTADNRIEGRCRQYSEKVWSNDADQDYTIYFVMEFDRPIKSMGSWKENERTEGETMSVNEANNAGVWVEFDTKENPVVQVRTGISLASLKNAALNLETEITKPFGWDYEAVCNNQKAVWNDIFSRIEITTPDRIEKIRFYTNMYRALCSRNIWSDVNGEWTAPDEKIRTLPNPDDDVALGCDAFWNTFWNLNQFWNLVTPEWSSRWVRSQLAMYDANGWLAKGPAGMEYIPVMVAEHEIPLMISAYQMGIRDYDAEKLFAAAKKMQTVPSQKVAGGYAGNRDLLPYLKYHYVPTDLGRFSNSLEYSYDDWTLSQLALALGKDDDYKTFADRGTWWKNTINPDDGYAHMRDSRGEWEKDFDYLYSGAGHHYVEGNAWQLTYFVPQDVPALAEAIGKDRFVERLQWGFEKSEPVRYNSPNDKFEDYPVVQGNQQSMHFAFLFNWVGKPWLTQKWSRSVIDRYYGCGLSNAYLGDEDQGQMSAWFIMAALGLFQTDGGCSVNPVYEIASPLYEKVVINLGERYGRGKTFTLEAKNASRTNKYVQSATLNGQPLKSFKFPASELLKGGNLVIEMAAEPNYSWGVE